MHQNNSITQGFSKEKIEEESILEEGDTLLIIRNENGVQDMKIKKGVTKFYAEGFMVFNNIEKKLETKPILELEENDKKNKKSTKHTKTNIGISLEMESKNGRNFFLINGIIADKNNFLLNKKTNLIFEETSLHYKRKIYDKILTKNIKGFIGGTFYNFNNENNHENNIFGYKFFKTIEMNFNPKFFYNQNIFLKTEIGVIKKEEKRLLSFDFLTIINVQNNADFLIGFSETILTHEKNNKNFTKLKENNVKIGIIFKVKKSKNFTILTELKDSDIYSYKQNSLTLKYAQKF